MPFSQASDFTVLKGLELLQPFGIGNPEPIFASLPLRVEERKAFGHSREHISLEVTEEGSGITLQAKAWRQADQIPESIQGQRIRLAYYAGHQRLQRHRLGRTARQGLGSAVAGECA